MQYRFLLGFVLLIPSVSAFGQKINVLSPSSFLEDSAQAPKFSSAFLVTEGDTLITWQKEFNRTTVNYLNSKITKTVWKDSVEVCTQEGFMLKDFQVSCIRSDNDSNVIARTWKNVDEFRYARKAKGIEMFYVKSYTEGLRFKGYQKKGEEIKIELEVTPKPLVSNLDSLFEIVPRERKLSDTKREILVYFISKNKVNTISNPSDFNTFKIIIGLNPIMYSSNKSYLLFIEKTKTFQKASKYLVKKTTFSLDLQ
jgi:hypothetical protein